MSREFFGNHIGSSGELTIIADIKPGFVPISEQLTYATRLRQHLQMLSALRRNGLETDRAGVYVGPVDALRTLQFVRWTLIENDTKMLLSVNFDRPVEAYIRRIVDIAGPLLDTILCHCEGFLEGSSDQGFDGFLEFATRYQVPVELFAAAAPNVSVDDAEYFVDLDTKLRADPCKTLETFPTLKLQTTAEKLTISGETQTLALLDQAVNIIRIMHETADRFPEKDFRGDDSRDDLLYHRLTSRLVQGFWRRLKAIELNVAKQTGGPSPFDPTAPNVSVITHTISAAADATGSRKLVRVTELLKQFREPLEWLARPLKLRDRAVKAVIAKDTIQRGLLPDNSLVDAINWQKRGFKPTLSCMMLLRVDDTHAAAGFLEGMRTQLWPGDDVNPNYNLSITNNGLKSLGLPEETRARFPQAFREGMDARAGLLGDIEQNHPNEWNWPRINWPLGTAEAQQKRIAPSTIDIIIQVESDHCFTDAPEFDAQHPLYLEVKTVADLAQANGVTLLSVEPLQRRFNEAKKPIGHLGIVDGISQPKFAGDDGYEPDSPAKKIPNSPHSLLGELLVGRQNRLDLPGLEKEQDLPLRDGTFQVVRKTRLDVASFEQNYKIVSGATPAITQELIREKMVGRKVDGSSLSNSAKGLHDFNFVDDPKGEQTPLQSHIRRSNPREFDTPRILRRGYSYGPYRDQKGRKDADRGQMFIAYNANIAEQFETIQRWVSGGNSTGISSWHGDPLLAPKRNRGTRNFSFMHDGKPVVVELPDTPMAKLEWGIYAFVPSQEGLKQICKAAHSVASTPPEYPAEAYKLTEMSLAELRLLLDTTDDEQRDRTEGIWAYVRKFGPIKTQYGVLIGDKENVATVLGDDGSRFSTKDYYERMGASIGTQLLGYDPDPSNNGLEPLHNEQHGSERDVVNAFLNTLKVGPVFDQAYQAAQSRLKKLSFETQSLPDDGQNGRSVKDVGRRFEASRFINDVLGELCEAWFGVPATSLSSDGQLGKELFKIGGEDEPESTTPRCPHSFLAASYHVFPPYSNEHVEQEAKRRPKQALAALEAYIAEVNASDGPIPNSGSLLGYMLTKVADGSLCSTYWTPTKIAKFVAGACFGFVGPASGGFRSILFDWIKTEELWRLHQTFQVEKENGLQNAAVKTLMAPLLASLEKRPVPSKVYRRCVSAATLRSGNDNSPEIEIAPGEFVIVGLRSAIADGGDGRFFLFGGDYNDKTKPQPPHCCPGQDMGIYAQMGILSALLEYEWIAPQGPLSLWLKDPDPSQSAPASTAS